MGKKLCRRPKITKMNIELFRIITLLILYDVIFNEISFSASSGISDLRNDPLFLLITECSLLAIDLLLYSCGVRVKSAKKVNQGGVV